MDIERLLARNRPAIDHAIEKAVPKTLTRLRLQSLVGKPRYAFALQAAQSSVHEPIWDLLERGGKRWRPTLFLLIAEAFGAHPKKLVDLSVLPEVVHNGTLMVDDVEDNSDLRRGKPCIHKLFGVDVAINAGNAMYFLPLLVLQKQRKRFPASTLLAAYEIYSREMVNLSYGQGFDIWWHNHQQEPVTEEEYLQMCAFKTGTLARMAAKLGALFANASPKNLELAGEFAESIGVAFQIQDDVLNLVGKEGPYGKEIGGDISEGKRTLLTLHALQHASLEGRRHLLTILELHTKDPQKIRQAIQIIEGAGSINYAKQFARQLVLKAWKKFAPALKKGKAKDALEAFAYYLIDREI